MSNARTLAGLIDGSNIVVPSGYGLDFRSSSDSTETGVTVGIEVLSDYEQGTFTATISSYTGATAPTISSQNTGSYSSNYTKIGNTVCISVSIRIDFNSATTIDFGGLPFTASSGGGGAQIEDTANSVFASGIVATIQGSTNFRYILTGTNTGSARNVSFGFCYRTS